MVIHSGFHVIEVSLNFCICRGRGGFRGAGRGGRGARGGRGRGRGRGGYGGGRVDVADLDDEMAAYQQKAASRKVVAE